jgi:carbon monoxide dehydrogenase subunit G
MKLEGTIEIAAPMQEVWALLVNPVSLAACIPGVRDVRQVDERTFQGSVTASVGPMDGDFSFTAVLERQRFPDDLLVALEGTDSVTRSRLEGQIDVTLEDTDASGTILGYRAVVKVKGRLAILGEMVLRATASLMINQATRCLRSRLEVSGDGPAVPREEAGDQPRRSAGGSA